MKLMKSAASTMVGLCRNPVGYARFFSTLSAFRKRQIISARKLSVALEDVIPCFDDSSATTAFDAHYVYHTAWAARILSQSRPAFHVDISSSLYFNALLSAFIPVRFYDFRPPDLKLSNLTCEHIDLSRLSFDSDSIASLSCMHVIEHIGLGRYGDPLDPEGDLKAAAELQRVLAPGGELLMATPVGRSRVCFNAHRIYRHAEVLAMFPCLQSKSFALITDDGTFMPEASPEMADAQTYGCGCFRLVKAAA
jgi:SAM-dependent methyltransferase